MTIEFKREQIKDREEITREPFIGYFAPNGELINYNILFGGNYHDAWRNPVSTAFLSFVSYIIKGTSIEKLKERTIFANMVENNQYLGIREYVKRGYEIEYDFEYKSFDIFLKGLNEYIEREYHNHTNLSGYEKFEYNLLLFFQNAYKNRRFFDAIQRKITIEDPNVVQERLRYRYRNCDFSDYEIEEVYLEHLANELMAYFKDICVQYLGYDSLERFKPDGAEIKIPKRYTEYSFDFLKNPRVITSSYPNINERYYNYLLMDWTIHKLPRYNYNENTGIYEQSNFDLFYQSETEQKLEEEIKSIKRLVPLKERPKYFR